MPILPPLSRMTRKALNDLQHKVDQVMSLPPATGTTPAQVNAAVDKFLTENPPAAGQPGKSVTPAEVSQAVGEFLQANPPSPGKDGETPTAAQLGKMVSDFMVAHPAPAGRAPTAAEIATAVAAYLQVNPPSKGDAGPGPTAAQLTNAVATYLAANPIATPALPARYAKRHLTTATGTLAITWPSGRFTKDPQATAAVVINATDYVYRAQILTCTKDGLTLRVTRTQVAEQPIIVGGIVKPNELLTSSVSVMVTAQVDTD